MYLMFWMFQMLQMFQMSLMQVKHKIATSANNISKSLMSIFQIWILTWRHIFKIPHQRRSKSEKPEQKKHVFNFFRKLICVFTERISKGIGAATVQALVPTEILTRGICSWSRSLERSVFTFPDDSSMFRIYTGCPLITGTQLHLGYAQIYWVFFKFIILCRFCHTLFLVFILSTWHLNSIFPE